jgi:hypothetical protein
MDLIPPLPQADQPDAPMRRALGRAVLAGELVAGLVAFFIADAPDPVPAVALKDATVWRVEVWVLVSLLGYALVALPALAFHGWLFTRFQTPVGSVDAKKVTDPEQTDALGELRGVTGTVGENVTKGFEHVGKRLGAIEERLGLDPDADDEPEAEGGESGRSEA